MGSRECLVPEGLGKGEVDNPKKGAKKSFRRMAEYARRQRRGQVLHPGPRPHSTPSWGYGGNCGVGALARSTPGVGEGQRTKGRTEAFANKLAASGAVDLGDVRDSLDLVGKFIPGLSPVDPGGIKARDNGRPGLG